MVHFESSVSWNNIPTSSCRSRSVWLFYHNSIVNAESGSRVFCGIVCKHWACHLGPIRYLSAASRCQCNFETAIHLLRMILSSMSAGSPKIGTRIDYWGPVILLLHNLVLFKGSEQYWLSWDTSSSIQAISNSSYPKIYWLCTWKKAYMPHKLHARAPLQFRVTNQ